MDSFVRMQVPICSGEQVLAGVAWAPAPVLVVVLAASASAPDSHSWHGHTVGTADFQGTSVGVWSSDHTVPVEAEAEAVLKMAHPAHRSHCTSLLL